MRIRLPFAGTFFGLLLAAAYIGLTPLHLETYVNDKVLHFLTFFLLTIAFYWILDTSRRRTLNLTLLVCTGALSVGSEVLQGLLPNGRAFDIYDIAANVVGSLAALALCTLYHKRMLERRRAARGYGAVPGADVDGEGEDGEGADLELGEGVIGRSSGDGQEEGVTTNGNGNGRTRTLEEEVDNWDENAVDEWDEDEQDGGKGRKSSEPGAKKRED